MSVFLCELMFIMNFVCSLFHKTDGTETSVVCGKKKRGSMLDKNALFSVQYEPLKKNKDSGKWSRYIIVLYLSIM